MTKNKYFKIKKIKSLNGSIIFKVFGSVTWLDMLFGFSSEYTFDNSTLEEAIEQIGIISEDFIVEEKTVYKTKLDANKRLVS